MELVKEDLAVERTLLATERTFLSYIRTALTLFFVGVSFIKFFDNLILLVCGWIFIPAGVLLFLFGLRHYHKITEYIFHLKKTNHLK